jgi:NAD(P)H-dependent FMN reductase
MKLVIFNGSPRKTKSNSKLLMDHFMTGYNEICDDLVDVHYLADRKKLEELKKDFVEAECVIFIFPLYTDCMPGVVKEFFEDILKLGTVGAKKIGFIVQSGFLEAVHSIYLEPYLKKLTERLKYQYLGTIIKGGVEGIRVMPPWMTGKLFKKFRALGKFFAEKGAFNADIQAALRTPLRMSFIKRLIYRLISRTGLMDFYWNSNLKKNGAFKNRFAKPY